MNYKIINKNTYYRKGVFRHFSEDCKFSTSIADGFLIANVYRMLEQKIKCLFLRKCVFKADIQKDLSII